MGQVGVTLKVLVAVPSNEEVCSSTKDWATATKIEEKNNEGIACEYRKKSEKYFGNIHIADT